MAAEQIRILVADAHPMTHRAVCAVLADQADLEVVGVASTGRELIQLVPQLQPDVVLMAVQFPDIDGLEVVATLRKSRRRVGNVVFTSKDSVDYLQSALSLGATGYLLKEHISQLALAIRLVAENDIAVMPLDLVSLLLRKLEGQNMKTGVGDAFTSQTSTSAQPASPIGWEEPSVGLDTSGQPGLPGTVADDEAAV